jgi:threonine synthase
LPKPRADCAGKEGLSVELPCDYQALKAHLFSLLS